jgi:hypothetical protein
LGRAYARGVIAHRRIRAAASGSVLLAFIGLWIAHTLEYLRVWGAAGIVTSMTNPVHAYMLPLAAVLVVLSALFGIHLWRAWQALNDRLEHAALGLRRIWRGRAATPPDTLSSRSSAVARLTAIWLPLAAAQLVLYLIQENGETIARAQPAPGLGAISGIHWAAPLVHLYVSLLLACITRICQVLFRRRTVVVARVEALLRIAIRRRRSAPAAIVAWALRPTATPLGRFGRHLWRRPPPLLLAL